MSYADCLISSSQHMTYTYCCVYSARLLMMDRDLSETRRVLFQKN